METIESTNRPIRYISPTSDYGFKKIFGDKKMMMSFLNALFQRHGSNLEIADLDYIDKEVLEATSENRGVVYDLRCKTSQGEDIIVEMQKEGQDFFDNRIIYYLARDISIQGFKQGRLREGEEKQAWNFDIHRVIGVFLMDFYGADKNSEHPEKYSRNCWMSYGTHEIASPLQEYWKVQLPYYRSCNMKPEECETKLDYWLYNIANMKDMAQLAFTEKDPDFVYLSDMADFNAMTAAEQDRYIRLIDREVVYNNVLERKYRFGYADGESKGIEKGIAKGIEQANAENYIKTLEMAKKMKYAKKMSIDDIVFCTNLSRNEVEAL